MKLKSLFLIVVFIFTSTKTFAQKEVSKFNRKRVLIVGSSLVTAVSASYYYIEKSWWSEKQIPFHFDDGADLTYALNVDKCGHFLGGLHAADIFSSSMKWTGMKETHSLWSGAAFGFALQLAIEIKDAYAPYWGFSKWDLGLGTAGALWPVGQYYCNDLKAINFKFSYFKHSNIYWELDLQRGKETSQFSWHDDYPNQTYWATFDVNHFIETCNWPKWLDIAIGFGLDDTQYLNNNTKTGGNNEFYIALDYDLPKMLKKWDTKFSKKVKHWLNYIHFPAPTIMISPKVKFYPLFL